MKDTMLTVFGAIHTDISMFVDTMPGNGETVPGRDHVMTPGGSGANQAFAAARAEARVAFVGMVGDDDTGKRAATVLRRAGVMTSGIGVSDIHATGIAFIMRGHDQQSRTIACPGANLEAAADQVPEEVLGSSNHVLVQMVTPLAENIALLRKARINGATTILNLSPVVAFPVHMLADVDYRVITHSEARQLCRQLGLCDDYDYDDVARMAYAIAAQCGCVCLVTCSTHGATALYPDGTGWHVTTSESGHYDIVDATGSGDAYTGTLAACLENRMSLDKAMHYASPALSLTCMYKGAQAAFPYWAEIETASKDFNAPEAIVVE